jgi:hypothetical protein
MQKAEGLNRVIGGLANPFLFFPPLPYMAGELVLGSMGDGISLGLSLCPKTGVTSVYEYVYEYECCSC